MFPLGERLQTALDVGAGGTVALDADNLIAVSSLETYDVKVLVAEIATGPRAPLFSSHLSSEANERLRLQCHYFDH